MITDEAICYSTRGDLFYIPANNQEATEFCKRYGLPLRTEDWQEVVEAAENICEVLFDDEHPDDVMPDAE